MTILNERQIGFCLDKIESDLQPFSTAKHWLTRTQGVRAARLSARVQSLGVGRPSSPSSAGEFLAAEPPLLFYYLRTYPVLDVTRETKRNKRKRSELFFRWFPTPLDVSRLAIVTDVFKPSLPYLNRLLGSEVVSVQPLTPVCKQWCVKKTEKKKKTYLSVSGPVFGGFVFHLDVRWKGHHQCI